MTSAFIGVVYDEDSRKVVAIIDPTYAEQLDENHWTQSETERLKLVKLSRAEFELKTNLNDNKDALAAIQEFVEKIIAS